METLQRFSNKLSSTRILFHLFFIGSLFCLSCFVASAAKADLLVVPGVRIGAITLGASSAQMRKHQGKPSRTVRLGNGLFSESWVTRLKTQTRVTEDELTIIYRKGRAVQIKTSSPRFRTRNGLSSASPMSSIRRGLEPLVHSVRTDPENYILHYFDSVKTGLAFEWSGPKSGLVNYSDVPEFIIVHFKGTPVIPNKGSEWISSSSVLDLQDDNG